MRDERAVVVGALIADTAGDILGEGAPLVHGDYVAAGILELASLHLLQRGHEQRVLVIRPLALALPLAWRVEAVVVLVLVLFAVVPSLDTRLGPALDEFVQGVELHSSSLPLGGSIGAFGHGSSSSSAGLGGLVRGGLRLGLVSLVREGSDSDLPSAASFSFFSLSICSSFASPMASSSLRRPPWGLWVLRGGRAERRGSSPAGFVGILPEARVNLVPVLLLLVVGRVRVNVDLGVAAAAEDLVRFASCSSSAWRFRPVSFLARFSRATMDDDAQEGEAVLLFGGLSEASNSLLLQTRRTISASSWVGRRPRWP